MYVQTVLQALAILLVGMLLVFLALGLVVLLMMFMGRWGVPQAGSDMRPPKTQVLDQEAAKVAAIAVAIVLAQGNGQAEGSRAWRLATHEGEAGSWQALHRTRSLTSGLDRR